jgi:aspartate 1-decarboxylase
MMLLTLLKSEIRGATVTRVDHDCIDSFAFDTDLLDRNGIVSDEQVAFWNDIDGEQGCHHQYCRSLEGLK